MKKYTVTSLFGIFGVLSWVLTILLREQGSISSVFNFILGVMPNIGATWGSIAIVEKIFSKKKINFQFKMASMTAGGVFVLAFISEMVHDLFFNSPFDPCDMVATLLAILIYLVTFYFSKREAQCSTCQ